MPARWNDPRAFRENNLDAIRLLLAILVIYSHSYPLAAGGAMDHLGRWFGMDGGYLAVNGFFVISGFLISRSYLNTGPLRDYFKKRALRIVPGFAVAFLVSALVVAPLASSFATAFAPAQLGRAGLYLLSLYEYPPSPSMFPDNPYPTKVNGSLWTIQYECVYYIALVAVGAMGLLRRRGLLLLLVLALLVAPSIFESHGRILWWLQTVAHGSIGSLIGDPIIWIRFGTYFFAGASFYLFRDRITDRPWLPILCALVLAMAWQTSTLTFAMPVCGTYLLLWAGFQSRLSLRPLTRHGDFSYGTYLYAFPIQQLLMQHWPSLTPLRLFLCAAPCAVLAGSLSWHGVEKPMLKLKPRKTTATNLTPHAT